MSLRYQGGFISSFYNPLEVPDPPTGASASAGNTQADVSFTAPSDTGGSAITGYGVISDPGGFTATGSASPITVTGLTNGTSYTFKVWAANSYGPSAYSDQTGSVTPAVIGQQAYTTAGTYSWVAPSEVTSVSVVAVGAGSAGTSNGYGGGGGGLGWKNNITVVPGNSYTVVVGAAPYNSVSGDVGGDSYFINTSTVKGGGGNGNTSTNRGNYTGDGGGFGGSGSATGDYGGSGGGAGGYTGNGGNGTTYGTGQNGSGGGGGGGGSAPNGYAGIGAVGGGGVGILGQGANGVGGYYTYADPAGTGGATGGSGGTKCGAGNEPGGTWTTSGVYGGGGGVLSNPGGGAVRIIWPGTSRSFPSTNTGDL